MEMYLHERFKIDTLGIFSGRFEDVHSMFLQNYKNK